MLLHLLSTIHLYYNETYISKDISDLYLYNHKKTDNLDMNNQNNTSNLSFFSEC